MPDLPDLPDGDDRDSYGRRVQGHVYRRGAFGHMPAVPTHPDALRVAARSAMTTRAWAYVDGSAGSEDTARENRAAFRR